MTRLKKKTSFHRVTHTQCKHPASHLVSLGMSTSSHTPGRPVAERGEESEAVVALRRRTGCLSPSSLDLAHLKMRDDMSTVTEMSGVLLERALLISGFGG